MANLNRVLLIGNCTRDPELKSTVKGTPIAELGLAINRTLPPDEGGQRREETVFVDVTVWGRQAEVAQQYLRKGRGVFIEGRLHLETWDDKQTGQKRSKLKVVCEHLQLLGGKGQEGSAPAPGKPQPQRRPAPAKTVPAAVGPALPDDLEYDENGDPREIPF